MSYLHNATGPTTNPTIHPLRSQQPHLRAALERLLPETNRDRGIAALLIELAALRFEEEVRQKTAPKI